MRIVVSILNLNKERRITLMKKIFFTKAVLIVLAIALLGFGLTGCNVNLGPVVPPISTTGTVYLVIHGNYYYDLKMDGYTVISHASATTYTLPNVSVGNHTFEAIDDYWGATWGYYSETKYISAGSNYVHLYPGY